MRINEEDLHPACVPIEYAVDSSGCWICTSHVATCDGRQRVMRCGRRQIVARYIYELLVGEIPKGKYVLHRCDTPLCINPEHLWLGTIADNNKDRDVKGRGYSKLQVGEVLEIRERYSAGGVTQLELSEEYGVSAPTICMIVGDKSWKQIKEVYNE